jgi:hypothetical protein
MPAILAQPRRANQQISVQPFLQKYSRFLQTQITCLFPAIPCSMRGAYRDRHGRWAREAVDASVSPDERCTRGRRSRVVLTPRRWRHACGLLRRQRWQSSPVTGYLMHTSLLRRSARTDSLVRGSVVEGSLMSMEIGLGRFGDRRLEKGGPHCMLRSFDGRAPAFDALRGTGPKRSGSRVFCAMNG